MLVAGAFLAAGCAGDRDAGSAKSVPSQAVAQAADAAGLVLCDDIAKLGSGLEGSLGVRRNPDPIVEGVLATYWREHPDTFGGRWIDRDKGVLVLAFTDDAEAHREAILARAPSPYDYSGVEPRPSITDLRSLGEREDVTIDVVQVRYSRAELEAMQQQISRAVLGRDFGVMVAGIDIKPESTGRYSVVGGG